YVGGTGTDQAFAIAIDATGNVYLTGNTASVNFPTVGAVDPTCGTDGTCNGGNSDAFVVKLDATLSTAVYSTYLGGSGQDAGRGIAVDSLGNAYVTKLNPAGCGIADLVYSTFLGGALNDVGNAIIVDTADAAYVTGSTESANFPTTAGAVQTALGNPAGPTDAFVTKINALGTALTYSTYLGGDMSDEGLDITVDSAGNAYVTGATSSTDFPATGTFTFSSATQAFLTELNPAGTSLVVSRPVITGNLDTTARDPGAPSISVGIARDGAGNIYIVGSEIRAVVVTPKTDAFVVSFNSTATSTNTIFVGGSEDDFGLDLAVNAATGNVFLTGDTK